MVDRYSPSSQDRQIIAARLYGYLDALSSIDSWFRDHVMNCRLVNKNGRDFNSTVVDAIHEQLNEATVDIKFLEKGLTPFFKDELLQKPFASTVNQLGDAFKYTKHELIYQICDMISLMADDFRPLGKWLIDIDIKSEHSYCGVAIEFKEDVLIILSCRGDKG